MVSTGTSGGTRGPDTSGTAGTGGIAGQGDRSGLSGTLLAGRYLLGEQIDSGGMGSVHRATDLRTAGTVAVKLLHPVLAQDPTARERLRREAQIAASLTSPRIVRVIDLAEHEGTPFLVLEYVAGETLHSRIRREGALPVADALLVALEVARALEAAHAAGVVHRDLKPQNIKLVDGQVKVLDFGIAAVEGVPGLTVDGSFVGTPEYSAPERAMGEGDIRSDIFSLGVVLYTALTGRPPFRGPTPLATLRAQEQSAPAVPADLPAPVTEILVRALARDPAERYQSPRELVAALSAAAGETDHGVPGASGSATGGAPPTPFTPLAAATATPPEQATQALPGGGPLAAALPEAPTSFVGRERERAEVRRLLGTSPVVTLTGAGGTGKTRLALQVAREAAAQFRGSVTLVELAALTDAPQVPHALAAALGLRETTTRPLAQVIAEHIGAQQLLLILDNCEHVVAACAALAGALVRQCPALRILATSREALAVAGETVFPLQPLAQDPAVRLFAERAAAARPGFVLTDENARAVAEICARLDGLPLAIELAAARVRLLAPREIAARLESASGGLRLLASGPRDLPAHQQTLRATMDWSFNLLDEEEQAALAALAVFAGGWGIEAAEAVCGDFALELLGRLVDKSLVMVEADTGAAGAAAGPETRYRLLETVREYAAERLAGRPALQALARRRHAEQYLALVEEAETALTGPGQSAWLSRLQKELGNLRAALQWSLQESEAVVALRLSGSLARFWTIRGYHAEGQRWLDEALALANGRGDLPTAARAKAQLGAGLVGRARRDYPAAVEHLQEALRLFEAAGDASGVARAHTALGNVATDRGERDGARQHFEEALALTRRLADGPGVAQALQSLGTLLLSQGDAAGATPYLLESLDLQHNLGNTGGAASAMLMLAQASRRQGNRERAASLGEESLAAFRTLGNRLGTAMSLRVLGQVAGDAGDEQLAVARLEESVSMARELGDRWNLVPGLILLAESLARAGSVEQTAPLAHEALALARDLGMDGFARRAERVIAGE